MAPDPSPRQTSLWERAPASARPSRADPLPPPERTEVRVAGHPVLVGTSGFSFEDWTGPFYPRGLPPPERLPYYARYFPAVEVNSTYYGIPEPRVLDGMIAKVPERFEFVVKANQEMTHRDETAPRVHDDFRRAIEPLTSRDRLGGVLAQFPWRFRNEPASRKRLRALRRAFAGHPFFVEFRHASWMDEAVFAFLEDEEIGYCSVDEPALEGLVPPLARSTTDTAYVRFHGRNARNWWGRGEGDRYDYEYGRQELEEWLGKIRELAERADKTYVFFNNCHAGQAARNARLMLDMLHGDLV